MADDDKYSGRTGIINTLNSLSVLGVIALTILVLQGILIVTAFLSSIVPILVVLGLLGFSLVLLFVIVLARPNALYGPSAFITMLVSIVFPDEPVEVDLDIDKCVLEVRDEKGVKKFSRVPNIRQGVGGWFLSLSREIAPSDSVRLALVEHNGKKWRVRPFTPYQSEREGVEAT